MAKFQVETPSATQQKKVQQFCLLLLQGPHRRVGSKCSELVLRRLRAAVVASPRVTNRELVKPKHVHNAHL